LVVIGPEAPLVAGGKQAVCQRDYGFGRYPNRPGL
jgi:hypothetical protein